MPYDNQEVEFTTIYSTQPILRGEKDRIFLTLSRVVNKAKGFVSFFWKLQSQYLYQGNWCWSKKAATIRPTELDAFIAMAQDAKVISDALQQHTLDGTLDDFLKGLTGNHQKKDEIPEDPFK